MFNMSAGAYILCALSLLLSIILLLLFVNGHRTIWPTEPPLSLTEPHAVRALLSHPVPDQVRARGIPNARLIRAFKITNTFVCDSMEVHNAFTREARALLRAAGSTSSDWLRFADQAKVAVDAYLSFASATSGASAEYEPFVQFVAFSVILTVLFDVDAPPNPNDVLAVTRGINYLWRLSKTTEDMPPHVLDDINRHLRGWIPAQSNPLDFILPTFETMWRVVAVTVALTHKDATTLDVFGRFIEEPSSRQFQCFEVDAPSAEAVIAEAMRLHPPTRRIHRASTPSANWTSFIPSTINIYHAKKPRLTIADVGAVHRDQGVWGDDAHAFRPLRHHPDSLTAEQRGAFMPFGYGGLKCVASGWAPHAAGLIVAAILEKVGRTIEIREGCGVGGRDGWEGWEIKLNPAQPGHEVVAFSYNH